MIVSATKIPKYNFTDECLQPFQYLFMLSFQNLIIRSFQQLPRGWVLASDLHGLERVTHDLYLEFLTLVGHYIYVKVTISSLFHLAFHPGL